jgi:hypothetical protein
MTKGLEKFVLANAEKNIIIYLLKKNPTLTSTIKSNQIKSNQIKSNQIKSNQTSTADSIEQDAKQTNYLPWILGGVGVLAGIGILFYFLTRKKGGEE